MASANKMVPALLTKIKAHLGTYSTLKSSRFTDYSIDEEYTDYSAAIIDILTRKKKSDDVREALEAILKRHLVALYLHNKLAVLSTKVRSTPRSTSAPNTSPIIKDLRTLEQFNRLNILISMQEEDGDDDFDPQWSIPSIETEGLDEDGAAFTEYKQKLVGVEQHAVALKLDVAEYGKSVDAQVLDWLEANKDE